MRPILAITAIVSSLSATSHTAKADLTHYNDLLIGERAVGMGGAYTAVADDPSAIYYNPGGLAFVEQNRTSASGNAFVKKEVKAVDAFDDQDFVKTSSGVVPAYFGNVKIFGEGDERFVGGFGIAMTTNDIIDQEDEVDDSPTFKLKSMYGKLKLEQSETHFLIAGARKLGTETGIGFAAGVVMVKHSMQQYIKSVVGPVDNPKTPDKPIFGHISQNTAVTATSQALELTLGVRHELTPTVAVGFAATGFLTLAESFEGRIEKTTVATREDGTAFAPGELEDDEQAKVSETTVREKEDEFLDYMAPRLRVGVAVKPADAWLVALDGAFYAKPPKTNVTGLREQATWNASLGADRSFATGTSARLGVFTNRDATGKVTATSTSDEHIDYVGVSTGVAQAFGASAGSLSAVYQQGKGKARTVKIQGSEPVRDAVGESFYVQVAISGEL